MNSKWKFILTGMLLIGVASLWLFVAGCSQKTEIDKASATSEKTLYTCGMHPWIIQDHPGDCPICGMKLEPVRKNAGAVAAAGSSSAITIDPQTMQLMNLQTTEVMRGPLRRAIRTVGTIDYNETALSDVTIKFKGWIEKLNVDATGQLVHRGEPLFEIYSPELFSAEAEYLAVAGTNGDASATALRAAAKEKLKFYDVTAAQIAALEKAGAPGKTLTVLAPIDGFVIEKNVVQGQMVDAGMKLYRVADLGVVWVYAQVYEQDLPYIKLGQEAVVRLSSLPDREFRGRVTYVYPDVDEKTRTARVRLEFENPGYFLKPGMFVSVQIISELEASVLLVPDSAVLRSGEKNTVFVALPGGKFDPRTVVLGPEAEHDMYQVVSGLHEGEEVVTSGQFMLDSESQLREAIEKMRGPKSNGEALKRETVAAENSSSHQPTNASTISEPVVYVCPMPEHVSITYDHPGNCPICGMALVPVTPGELKWLQPGGRVLYYTCPMPEHNSAHYDKPGKCPICAMTLIPVMAEPETIQSSKNPSTQNPAPSPAPTDTGPPPAAQSGAKQLYTCPMHPEVISDEPGKCPKCGMNLVPVTDAKK